MKKDKEKKLHQCAIYKTVFGEKYKLKFMEKKENSNLTYALKNAQEVQTQFYDHYLFLTLIVNDFFYFL